MSSPVAKSEPSNTAANPNANPVKKSTSGGVAGVEKVKREPKICNHCELPINGQFVRAVNAHYHLDCFKCDDCGKIVAEKFFPVPPTADTIPSSTNKAGNEAGVASLGSNKTETAQQPSDPSKIPKKEKTLIYCETDYFKRLDLLCARCGLALRGPYIRVGKQKYHMDHFSCTVCSTVFQQHDSYYEKDGKIYCAPHFSVMFAVRCGGCSTAVLKNFVETTKENKVTQWHPCCYSLSKLWSVKMNGAGKKSSAGENKAEEEVRIQNEMVGRVEQILHTLSAFEESTAACVTEMMANFSSQHYRQGAASARRLIHHIELLYQSLEKVDQKLNEANDSKGYSNSKETRQLVKNIIQFFMIFAEQKSIEERVAATRDMIQLVTGLAHLLKTIIRCSIAGAVRLEQNHHDKEIVESLLQALQSCSTFDDSAMNLSSLANSLINNDFCTGCKNQIEGACFISPGPSCYKWHEACFKCSFCHTSISASYRDASFNPLNGSVQCKSHKTPAGHYGITKVLPCTQYINILNASWSNLYVNLKIQETEFLHSDGKELSLGSIEVASGISASATPKKEEFFDDEEGAGGISPAQKRDANRVSGHGLDWKVTQDIDDKIPYLTEVSGLQFLATRQLAALALHRHLENWFTLSKLLQIAEGPKTTIWSKMFSKKEKKKIDRTFGSALDVLVDNYGVDTTLGFGFGQVRIPIIVQEAIVKLKRSGMTTEGIFRKNGNIRRLKEQCEEIDNDPKNINFQNDNEIQVAALLKKFLRDLPEPLMTEALYELFLCVPKIDRKEDQVAVIQLIMCLLPKPNIDLLSVLVRFFVEVSSMSGVHRMDLDNMATVIAPNILYDKINPVEHTAVVIDVIRLLFLSHASIFKVPAAIKDSLGAAEENPISMEFVKKYEQALSSSKAKQNPSSAGTHFSEGVVPAKN